MQRTGSPIRTSKQREAAGVTGTLANNVNIFISHSGEDHKVAEEIRRQLCRYAGGRLEVCISQDFLIGSEWLDRITEYLSTCRLLLIIYTNTKSSWERCLLEAGLFIQPESDHRSRVLSIRNPESPYATELTDFEAIDASVPQLTEFLAALYGSGNWTGDIPPINEDHAHDSAELTRQASEIAALFSPPSIRSVFLPRRLVLHIDGIESMKHGAIPDDSRVEINSHTLGEIFGLTEGNWNWSELKARARRRGDIAWIDELSGAIMEAGTGTTDVRIANTFRATKGGRIYRPLLYRVDYREDKPVKFHVVFTEERNPRDVAGHGTIGVAFNMLRLGHRFRREVLHSYMGRMEELAMGDTPEIACQRLREAIRVIEQESEDLGLIEEGIMASVFQTEHDKTRLDEMLSDWKVNIRDKLFDSLKQSDIPAVEELLGKLEDKNRKFMSMAGRRYAKLISEADST